MTRQQPPYIWMYHSIAEYDDDPMLITVRPRRLERQLWWLRQQGLRGVGVAELLTAADRGRAAGLVGLTFDDGYADFVTDALPVLLRHGCTATVYVLAERIGGDNDWDRPGPSKRLLTLPQMREVAAAGMEIGSHGLRHTALPAATDDEIELEVTRSRHILSELLGTEVQGFAYPYGFAGQREVDAVRRAGYRHGCAIWPNRHVGRFALPRTFVGEKDGPARLRVKRLRHARRRYLTDAEVTAR